MGRTQRRAMKAYLPVCRVAISEYGLSQREFPRPQQMECEKSGLARISYTPSSRGRGNVMGRTQRRAMKAYLPVCRVAISEYGLSQREFPRPQQMEREKCGLARISYTPSSRGRGNAVVMGRTQRRAMKAYLPVCRVAISEYGLSQRGFPRPQQMECEKSGLRSLPSRHGPKRRISSVRVSQAAR